VELFSALRTVAGRNERLWSSTTNQEATMSNSSTKSTKLSLRRESLKELTAADLSGVAGAYVHSYRACTGTCPI
jgi:hypothetical protein